MPSKGKVLLCNHCFIRVIENRRGPTVALCVVSLEDDEDYWIGLVAPAAPCNLCSKPDKPDCDECRALWTWLDGTPTLNASGHMLLNNWKNDDPDSIDDCVQLRDDGMWQDRGCDNDKPYICKRPVHGESDERYKNLMIVVAKRIPNFIML